MWYFRSLSQEGQIGPLDGLMAANYVRSNPGAYCWRMGFIQWLPVRAVGDFGSQQPSMRSQAAADRPADVIDFLIFGDDAQYVEIELDPGESAISLPANLIYMSPTVGIGPSESRMSLFTHKGEGKAKVALSSPLAGAVAPVDLKEFNGDLITTYYNFIAAARGVKVTPSPLAGMDKGAAGEVFCRLSGDGWAFIHVAGTAVDRTLAEGESLQVNAACVAAMTPDVKAEKAVTAGSTTVLTLTGPGRVWLESLSGAPRS